MSEPRAVVIYGLECPIESKIMYVGKAFDEISRLRQHIYGAKAGGSTRKDEWLKMLDGLGLVPSIVILDRCTELDCGKQESHWIKEYQSINPELTNSRTVKSEDVAKSAGSLTTITIQMSDVSIEQVKHLATEVYGFKNAGELIRSLIHYIAANRPTLSKVRTFESRI